MYTGHLSYTCDTIDLNSVSEMRTPTRKDRMILASEYTSPAKMGYTSTRSIPFSPDATDPIRSAVGGTDRASPR